MFYFEFELNFCTFTPATFLNQVFLYFDLQQTYYTDNIIKILFISHSPYFNGAEICLLNLINSLDRKIFEPVVVFPYSGPLSKHLMDLGFKIYFSPIERWIRFKYDKPVKDMKLKKRVTQIANIIELESIDIVHTNTSVVLEGALAAKIKNIPHVWHIHEYLKGHSELYSCFSLPFVYHIMSLLSDKVVTVSQFGKRQFDSIVGDEKISVIYNGIQRKKETANLHLRDELNISNDDLIIVAVGLLSEAKGYNNFLETAKYLRDTNKIKFIWIGDSVNNCKKDFKNKIEKLHLENNVFYLGFRRDVSNLLKSSDIFVCTSSMEAFPLSILEAMGAGLPVITTDCGGPSEIVIENKTGFIVPVNGSRKMSEKILELYNNEVRRKTFGEEGSKRYEENFTIEKFTRKFEDLYNNIYLNRHDLLSKKDEIFIDALMELYEDISKAHWKKIKKL